MKINYTSAYEFRLIPCNNPLCVAFFPIGVFYDFNFFCPKLRSASCLKFTKKKKNFKVPRRDRNLYIITFDAPKLFTITLRLMRSRADQLTSLGADNYPIYFLAGLFYVLPRSSRKSSVEREDCI